MADRARAVFDFLGAGLVIEAAGPSWLAAAQSAFGPFAADRPGAGAFRLEIGEEDEPAVPEGLPLVWEGEFLDRRAGRIFETDRLQVIEVTGWGHLEIDHAEGRAQARMRPGSEKAFAFTPLMNVLDAALRTKGKHLFHAACLATRDGSGAVLVCAPSGFGKTTTSLALARGGFGLVTDDASIVEFEPRQPRAWGLPRSLKVHRRTAELLPWIGELPDAWNAEGEQVVRAGRLAGTIAISEPVPRDVAAVLVLGNRREEGHRIAPLAKSEALLRIARDNVSNGRAGVNSRSRGHFEAFAELLRDTQVFELNAGPELESLADLVDAALSPRGRA